LALLRLQPDLNQPADGFVRNSAAVARAITSSSDAVDAEHDGLPIGQDAPQRLRNGP
jgi:hypothetical protein